MFAINHVLVATDFSECSTAALEYGRALAQRFGARLHVLHVVETRMTAGFATEAYLNTSPELQIEIEQAGRIRLDQLVSAEERAVGARAVLRTLETPAHAIVDYAASEHIDLIVIGTHGRRGLSHLVMGSVAEKVMRTAPCPVLTLRHPERDFVTPSPVSEAAVSNF
ncbi:MAG: universal stress protein [Vicinamibacterales bacterium]